MGRNADEGERRRGPGAPGLVKAGHRDTAIVEIDTDKVDEAILALLYLGRHDGYRAWKGFDWDAMHRLHAKGYITDPVGKAKSVVFSEEGLREAERLFRERFLRQVAGR